MQKDSGDDGTSKQVKLGELLVQKGYINDVQLLQALAESKRQKSQLVQLYSNWDLLPWIN